MYLFTNLRNRRIALLISLTVVLLSPSALAETQVVILGTRTPVPDWERSGPSTAVIYDGEAYVFDAGGGMVQRAIEASKTLGIEALYPTNIKHLFFTHLHSDHILDYPELVATYWWRRTERLHVYGPKGTRRMTRGYYKFIAADIHIRTSGNQPVVDETMYRTRVHEYRCAGWQVQDGDVLIEAFEVSHGSAEPAFGYKITTPDKTIVISGDTCYNENVVEMATGVDILIHEVANEAGWSRLPEEWQEYHHAGHTLSSEVAEVANLAQPGLLILTHILFYSAPVESTLDEVKALYNGPVVLPDDLDVF